MPHPTFLRLPAEKRERIAEIAIEEFSEKPYAKVSISGLVKRAGIAKGSFYQYFDGKLDLFRWLLAEHAEQRRVQLFRENPPPPDADFFGQLAHLFALGLRFGIENPRLARIASALWHAPRDPELEPLYREMAAERRRHTLALLELGVRSGQLREDLDLELAADFMIAALEQGLDFSLKRLLGLELIEYCSLPELARRFPEERLHELISSFADLLRRGLGHPDTAGRAAPLEHNLLAQALGSDPAGS